MAMQSDPPVVLIVDDDEDSLAMYAFGLLAMGFQPVMAADADEAFARACELQPDLVVADVVMPGVSGLELARRLRAEDRTKDAIIVTLTGRVTRDLPSEALSAGSDRFLTKPCLPDELARELRALLQIRHGAAVAPSPH